MLSNATALLDGSGVIMIQQAFGTISHAAGQTRTGEEAVERRKILPAFLIEDRFEIELDISLTVDKRRVAQKAEAKTIRNDPPDLFGAVQIFLHERMRRE